MVPCATSYEPASDPDHDARSTTPEEHEHGGHRVEHRLVRPRTGLARPQLVDDDVATITIEHHHEDDDRAP